MLLTNDDDAAHDVRSGHTMCDLPHRLQIRYSYTSSRWGVNGRPKDPNDGSHRQHGAQVGGVGGRWKIHSC